MRSISPPPYRAGGEPDSMAAIVPRARTLRRPSELPGAPISPFGTEVLRVLLRGRVAERLGERNRAFQSYTWVAGMWRNADPALQPYGREAREGLARLTNID